MPKNKNNRNLYVGGDDKIDQLEKQINALIKQQKQMDDLIKQKKNEVERERISKENETKNLNNNNAHLMNQLGTKIKDALNMQIYKSKTDRLFAFKELLDNPWRRHTKTENDNIYNETDVIEKYLKKKHHYCFRKWRILIIICLIFS